MSGGTFNYDEGRLLDIVETLLEEQEEGLEGYLSGRGVKVVGQVIRHTEALYKLLMSLDMCISGDSSEEVFDVEYNKYRAAIAPKWED